MYYYHGYRPSTGLLLGYLEVQKRAIFLGVFKVELVETADPGEQHAVVKLVHVAACLHYHRRVGWSAFLFWQW